jgi:hypothetical protein
LFHFWPYFSGCRTKYNLNVSSKSDQGYRCFRILTRMHNGLRWDNWTALEIFSIIAWWFVLISLLIYRVVIPKKDDCSKEFSIVKTRFLDIGLKPRIGRLDVPIQ